MRGSLAYGIQHSDGSMTLEGYRSFIDFIIETIFSSSRCLCLQHLLSLPLL